jgi:hypothetical protein
MTEETAGLDKLERDVRYLNAMKQIHLAYPDDLEARVFYGLSILGVGSVNRDYATYMRVAAVITPVWDANRSHPSAAPARSRSPRTEQLSRSQRRTNSLIGLARASSRIGSKARESYDLLTQIWYSADGSLPAHVEVAKFEGR